MPNEPTQQLTTHQTKIDPDILQKVGLTPEKVEEILSQEERKKQLLITSEQNGSKAYQNLKAEADKPLSVIQVASSSFEITPSRTPNEVLPNLLGKLPQLKQSPQFTDIEPTLKAYFKGFGGSAVRDGDYQTGINCINFALDGNILKPQHQAEIDSIVNQANSNQNPDQKKLEIAQILQTIKNRLNPAQEQTLRPVEPQVAQDSQAAA